MSRFLVYATPAVGHTLPLVPGLLELQRRGHQVQLRALPSLVPTLREAGLDALPVAPEVADVPVTDHLAKTGKERLAAGQVDLMERGRYDGPDLAAAIDAFAPDALLVDSISYGALTTAERSGLPRATLSPSVLAMPGRGIPPYGPGLPPMGGPLGRVRDAVLWRVMERVFGKAMLPGLNRLRREAGLPEMTSPLELAERTDALIVMTGEPIEYPRPDKPDHVHFVGFQTWDPPAERPEWLDEPGDPWVLVTCSTEYQGDERLAEVAAEAFRDEPVRVLLTLADAYDGAAVRTAGNVRVERFVPHGQVLPHCAAVVCHGGMGIVGKAFAHGVPMVVVPFGRDQPEVGWRVSEAGLGATVRPKQLSPQRLRGALRQALASTDTARSAASRAAAADPARAFADAAETLLRPDRARSVTT
ncbi:MAG TPA: glycosyltransferase [Marmoricola sp.]|nr:glycosyltransferase [Marmoricola sp.]